VRQFGVITVLGTTDITADGGAANVQFHTEANVLSNTVSLKCHHCKVKNSKEVELGTIDAAGAMVAIAYGPITQSAPSVITVASISTITAQSSDGNTDYDVTLGNTSNDFEGNLIVTAANVRIKDTSTSTFGSTSVSGNYSLTTTGEVTDAADIDIDGTTTISTPGSDITLDRTGNDFSGAVAVIGADVELVDTNGIILGDSTASGAFEVTASAGDLYINAGTDLTVGGNLNITATAGNITQGAAVTVTGTSSFETIATGADIILGSANALGGR
jgi:hypothetical protein